MDKFKRKYAILLILFLLLSCDLFSSNKMTQEEIGQDAESTFSDDLNNYDAYIDQENGTSEDLNHDVVYSDQENDTSDPKTISPSGNLPYRARRIAFNSDGTKLAVLTDEGGIWVQDLTGEKNFIFEKINQETRFSSIGDHVFFWVPGTSNFIVHHPGENKLLAFNVDDSVILNEVETIPKYHGFECSLTLMGIICSGFINEPGRGGFYHVQLIDELTLELIINSGRSGHRISNFVISPDGSKFIHNNIVKQMIWDEWVYEEPETIIELTKNCDPSGHTSPPHKWSSAGKFIIQVKQHNVLYDPCAWIYNVENNYEFIDITNIAYPTRDVTLLFDHIEFSPADDKFAFIQYQYEAIIDFEKMESTFDIDIALKVFDSNSLLELQVLSFPNELHESLPLGDFVWSNDGNYLAAIYSGGVLIFDVNSGEQVYYLKYGGDQ